jgi:hypothetical protein
MALTVLVNARPWLSSTSAVCGDIENVIATLVPALRQRASVSCSSWLLPARFPLPALGRCSDADTRAARSGSAASASRAVTE